MHKIAYISPFFPPADSGGVSDYSFIYLNELRKDKRITVSHFLKSGKYFKIDKINQYPIIKLKLSSIKDLLTNKDYHESTIVHIELPSSNIYLIYYVILIIITKIKFKKIILIRLHEYAERPKIKRFILYLIVLLSSKVICNSNEDRILLNKKVRNKDKIQFVPIFSNISFNEKPIRKDINDIKKKYKDKLIIGYFGQIIKKHDHKGGWIIIDIINKLNDVYNFNEFLFIKIGGNDNSEEIYKKSINNRSNIMFTGYLPNDMISDYIKISDVMLFPYRYGFKGKRGSTIAAIMHNKCIITTKNKYEIYPEGINDSICFTELDDDLICKKIIELNNSKELIINYGKNVSKIKHYYSIKRIVKEIINTYDQC